MGRRLHVALGILVGAALERNDVRKISGVFYDADELIVKVQFADAAIADVGISVKQSHVDGKKLADLEHWADDLLDERLGTDDDLDQEDEEQDEEQDDEG